jgi:RimJ/RimL family protein N-acetyltransferase
MKLREFVKDDIQSIVKHGSNFNVSRYLTAKFPYPYKTKHAEWWVNEGSKIGLHKAIDLDGECIGGIGITFGEDERRYSSLIGYWLGESHWGKGIATEALSIMTEEAFSSFKIMRLYAPVYSPNKASMRVLEKCGYRLEGVFLKAIYKNGPFMDEHIYAKLKNPIVLEDIV